MESVPNNRPPKAPAASGSGSASKANAPNVDPCSTKCVPTFVKVSNRSVKKHCSKNQYNGASCLLERPREASFYDTIDWNVLSTHIDKYTRAVEQTIMEDNDLSRDIQILYTYGPFPLERDWPDRRRPVQYAVMDIRPEINRDDYKFCNDLILKIFINRGIGASGRKKQVIGHISLHPRLPKYYQSRLRDHDGCGYMTKQGENGGARDSPFQYVIESVKWKSMELKSNNPFRPYAPMFADEAHPGTFLPIEDSFSQVDMADFPVDMTAAEKELLKSIHVRIGNHFIRLWNTVFQVGAANLPKVRRNVGGFRRKTRKVRPSRK